MKFPINNFFSKCDQICRKLRIWSHLGKYSLMENFIFCAMGLSKVLQSFLKSCSIETTCQQNINKRIECIVGTGREAASQRYLYIKFTHLKMMIPHQRCSHHFTKNLRPEFCEISPTDHVPVDLVLVKLEKF